MNMETLAPQEWIEKLAPSGLLNLLHILHFARSLELSVVVKVLFSCVHDGYLSLDCKIDLNVDVIHRITRFNKVGTIGRDIVGLQLCRSTFPVDHCRSAT